MIRRFVAVAVVLMIASPAMPHIIGLDKKGCHTEKKTGDYHCHDAAPTRPTRSSENKELVRAAQTLLQTLGYDTPLAGSVDSPTRAAILAFQRAEDLELDGAVTDYLVLKLAQAVAKRCR